MPSRRDGGPKSVALLVEPVDLTDFVDHFGERIHGKAAVRIGIDQQLHARRDEGAHLRVQQPVAVDWILTVAVRRRQPLLDPALGRQCSRHGRRGDDPIVERGQEERGHAAAGSSGRADSPRVQIRSSDQVVDRSPRIQQLDRERREAAAVPMKPGVGIHTVMGELDLTHLDVVHHQHRHPVCGKPCAVTPKQTLARVAALIQQNRDGLRAAAREVQVGGQEHPWNGLEHQVLDDVGGVLLPVRNGCPRWPIRPGHVSPEHPLECGPRLLLPRLPLLDGRNPAKELLVTAFDHELEVRLQRFELRVGARRCLCSGPGDRCQRDHCGNRPTN